MAEEDARLGGALLVADEADLASNMVLGAVTTFAAGNGLSKATRLREGVPSPACAAATGLYLTRAGDQRPARRRR